MKKILTIIGARPQFIKAGILSKEMNSVFNEIIVHTGQHYDPNMSDVFFEELDIKRPKYNLNVGSSSHATQTAHMMIKIEEVIEKEQPDAVLIYGDTNSTVAAALTASKLLIPVFHVEGGIRTKCMDMPEEQNRIVSDHLSSLIFVSTEDNLLEAKNEGLGGRSFLVGDIMYDSLVYYSEQSEKLGWDYFSKRIDGIFDERVINKEYILATIHRPENTDRGENIEQILNALNTQEQQVILSTHPRIRKQIEKVYSNYENIYFVEPLSYLETVYFTKKAVMVVTDSGGLHKEAYLQGTPCVTILRSGWMETTKGGWNQFVAPLTSSINSAIQNSNVDKSVERNDFGDGNACKRIIKLMCKFFDDESMHLY